MVAAFISFNMFYNTHMHSRLQLGTAEIANNSDRRNKKVATVMVWYGIVEFNVPLDIA